MRQTKILALPIDANEWPKSPELAALVAKVTGMVENVAAAAAADANNLKGLYSKSAAPEFLKANADTTTKMLGDILTKELDGPRKVKALIEDRFIAKIQKLTVGADPVEAKDRLDMVREHFRKLDPIQRGPELIAMTARKGVSTDDLLMAIKAISEMPSIVRLVDQPTLDRVVREALKKSDPDGAEAIADIEEAFKHAEAAVASAKKHVAKVYEQPNPAVSVTVTPAEKKPSPYIPPFTPAERQKAIDDALASVGQAPAAPITPSNPVTVIPASAKTAADVEKSLAAAKPKQATAVV